MPMLGGCCFCFDLKVGTQIIGVISLIFGILATLSGTSMVLMMDFVIRTLSETRRFLEEESKRQKMNSSSVNDDDYQDENQIEGINIILKLVNDHLDGVAIVTYVYLALALLNVITSSMLIHGVKKNSRCLLLPWLFQTTLVLICVVALDILFFVLMGSTTVSWGLVGSTLVTLALYIYCMLVVISQYQALGLIRMHEEICMK